MQSSVDWVDLIIVPEKGCCNQGRSLDHYFHYLRSYFESLSMSGSIGYPECVVFQAHTSSAVRAVTLAQVSMWLMRT